MQDVKEEIKARLPIEDVISQYIELKRAGRTFKGHSPWGVDRTPSFMVSPEKGIWHDFSANKGGDIFTFLMEVEGITFREALEKLAGQAGVELKKYGNDGKVIARRKMRAREALELACKYYQVCLAKNKTIYEYVFYKRNINRGTMVDFRLGYAPNGGAEKRNYLVEFLTKKGYTKQEMEDAGLLNRFSGDIFKGRLMVPFFDTTGSVIGFTGRVIDKGEPKYLNTPETILFNKGRFVFGLAQAKEAIRRNGFLVVVEGNMDVISSHQAGVQEAVATSGTAMTENHLKILSRLTNDIRLAYDSDEAGVRATEQVIQKAEKMGISLSVVGSYGEAKDPDELIQQDPEKWRQCVLDSQPAVEWVISQYEKKCDLLTGPGKKEFSDKAMQIIMYLEDGVERAHYKQKVAEKLGVSVADLEQKKLSVERKRLKPIKKKEGEVDPGVKKMQEVERDLQAILVYGGASGALINLDMPTDEMRLEELSLVFEEKFAKMPESELTKAVSSMVFWYENERKKNEILELQEKLVQFEDDADKTAEILKQIRTLQMGLKKS